MPQIRAVIFDCYTTLIDIRTNENKPEVFRGVSGYLQYYGLHTDEDSLRSGLRRETEQYLRAKDEVYPEVDLEAVFRNLLRKEGLDDAFLAESCCRLYRLLSREHMGLHRDCLPVLRQIKRSNYRIGVVSDAQKVFTPQECRMLALDRFFEVSVLSSQYGFRKPDPRLYMIACSLLGIQGEEAVYIGDDPGKDVKGARQIGMKSILVMRNKGPFHEVETKPDFFAKDLWEAWDWIKKMR